MSTDNSRWRDRAACKNAPVELFIRPDGVDDPYYPSPAAQAFCDMCRVKVECLGWATEHNEVGVWGGTTEYQRNQLKREMERSKCPSCGSDDLIYENTIELCLACGISWHII